MAETRKYIVVRFRDHKGWVCVGETEWRKEPRYTKSGRRRGYNYIQWSIARPEPTESAFVEAYKIVDAQSEEEACQLASI